MASLLSSRKQNNEGVVHLGGELKALPRASRNGSRSTSSTTEC